MGGFSLFLNILWIVFGGAWMAAVLGFGGLRTDEHGATITPRLYRRWKSLQFNLTYRGDRFRITRDLRYDASPESASGEFLPTGVRA